MLPNHCPKMIAVDSVVTVNRKKVQVFAILFFIKSIGIDYPKTMRNFFYFILFKFKVSCGLESSIQSCKTCALGRFASIVIVCDLSWPKI